MAADPGSPRTRRVRTPSRRVREPAPALTNAEAARAYLDRAIRDPRRWDARTASLALAIRRNPGMSTAQIGAAYEAITSYASTGFAYRESQQGLKGAVQGASRPVKAGKELDKGLKETGSAVGGAITLANDAIFKTPEALEEARRVWENPDATVWGKISAEATVAAAASSIPRGLADLVKSSKRIKKGTETIPLLGRFIAFASPTTYATIYAADLVATGATARDAAMRGTLDGRTRFELGVRAASDVANGWVQAIFVGFSKSYRTIKTTARDAKLGVLVEAAKARGLPYDYEKLRPGTEGFKDAYDALRADARLADAMPSAKAAKLGVYTSRWSRALSWLSAIGAAGDAAKGLVKSRDPDSSPEAARADARNALAGGLDAAAYRELKDPRAIMLYVAANVAAGAALPDEAVAHHGFVEAGLPGTDPAELRLPDGTITVASDPWAGLNGRFGTQTLGQLAGLGLQRLSERVRGDTRARQVRAVYQEAADGAQATAIALRLLADERRTGEPTSEFGLAKATLNAGRTTADRAIAEAFRPLPTAPPPEGYLPAPGLTIFGLLTGDAAAVDAGKSGNDLAMERRVGTELDGLRRDLAGATAEQVEDLARLNPRQRPAGATLALGVWDRLRRAGEAMRGRGT